MAKKWCIVIPLSTKNKAKYAAMCLKDYTCLQKLIKEVEIDGQEEEVDYAYIDMLIIKGGH